MRRKTIMSLLFTAVVSLFSVTVKAEDLYKENLSNAGFEESKETSFMGSVQTTFEDWDISATFEHVIAEKNDKIEGSQALKINGSAQKISNISQNVFSALNPPTVGAVYEVKVNYKILSEMALTDTVQIFSYWKSSRDGQLDADKDKLIKLLTVTGEWKEETIVTTCPEGATSFVFNLRVSKGVVVLFDDFSLRRQQTTKPTMNVKSTITRATADINTSVTFPPIVVEQANLTLPIEVEITGANREYFSSSVSSIPAADGTSEIIVTYRPTKVGEHRAMVNIQGGDKIEGFESLYHSVSLTGVCSDPSVPAAITIEPAALEAFEGMVGKEEQKLLKLTSVSCLKPIDVRVTHVDKAGFVVNGSQFPQNIDVNVTVTFKPTQVGEYHSYITFSSEGAKDVVLDLKGTAVADPTEPDKMTATFSFDWDNPHKLIFEKFESVEHNKTLAIDEWQNVVPKGNRAWWGFEHKKDDKVVERSAKATSYGYQVPSDGSRAEMWMVTPMLDYKNAAGRVFTFRVMGDFMPEKHDTELSVWLIDSLPDDKEPLFRKMEGIGIPVTKDLNGEWSEIHLNLDDQDIADVFCVGFKYDGLIGEENSVVYYIDDVSWGRTDLPVISADSVLVRMEAEQSKLKQSGLIKVTAKNLTEPIRLAIGGSNPSNFEVKSLADGSNVLAAEGGTFVVNFESDNIGVHEAYIKLSSRGAADLYIPMAVRCVVNSDVVNVSDGNVECWIADGMLNVSAEGMMSVELFDVAGRMVMSCPADSDIMSLSMPSKGVYVVKVNTVTGVSVRKVML